MLFQNKYFKLVIFPEYNKYFYYLTKKRSSFQTVPLLLTEKYKYCLSILYDMKRYNLILLFILDFFVSKA